MIVVLLAIPGRIYFGERLRRDEPLMRPYDLLARQLEAELPGVAYLLGDSLLTAGNLKMQIPKAPSAHAVNGASVSKQESTVPCCLGCTPRRRHAAEAAGFSLRAGG
jgi:hypothetical protein